MGSGDHMKQNTTRNLLTKISFHVYNLKESLIGASSRQNCVVVFERWKRVGIPWFPAAPRNSHTLSLASKGSQRAPREPPETPQRLSETPISCPSNRECKIIMAPWIHNNLQLVCNSRHLTKTTFFTRSRSSSTW